MNGNELAATPNIFDARNDDRVRNHTAPSVNSRIDHLTNASLEATMQQGRDAMVARLKELDREWDVDRALMLNFAIAGTLSLELGQRRHRGFMHLFRAQLGFLLMHAVVGWCPPLPIFRRLGFRTAKEIAAERAALITRLAATANAT